MSPASRPSGKTWPRCAPHRAHTTSTRSSPSEWSGRVATAPSFAIASRQVLFSVAEIATATPHRNYDVSPDGTTFAMVRFNPASRVMVIQNLPALVRRLSGAEARAR